MAKGQPGGDTRPVSPAPGAPSGLRLLPYYLGGFLGPFGTIVPVPFLPDLRDHFGVDSAQVSWTISAYLLPMAGLMLVSGTIGERFGRSRVLRTTLTVYIGASILVAVAPGFGTFLAARSLQGAANAFFTPLLLASLADLTPEAELGRRIGMYSSFQAVGGAAAPFVGGLVAEIDWRLAFVATAIVTGFILASAPGPTPQTTVERPPIRPLFSGRLLALGLASLAATAGPLGAQVLVGFKLRDALDVEPGPAGLVLAGGLVAAALLGPSFGRATDRWGPRRCGMLGLTGVGVTVAAIGPVESLTTMTLLWLVAGALYGLVTVALHRVAAVIIPANRGGALSLVLSFRFLGLAIGPLIWVPVLTDSVSAAFAGSALLGLVSLVGLALAVPPGRSSAGARPPMGLDRAAEAGSPG